MNRQRAAWLLSFVLLAIAAFLKPSAAQRDSDYLFVRTLVDVHRQVESNYVDKVDTAKLEQAAIEGMLGALDDPHTVYVPPEKSKGFKGALEGKFEGVGVQLNQLPTGEIQVVTPIDGSPAFRAGVKTGDIILKVDGESVKGLPIEKVTERIKGQPGSDVALTVKRVTGQELDLRMKRGEVIMPTVLGYERAADDSWDYYLLRNPKVAYIRVTQFTPTMFDAIHTIGSSLLRDGMQAMILDLRWNPGGQLDQAVQLANLFLKQGAIVKTSGRNRPERVERADGKGTLTEFPLIVLVNEHTASASEIVAGALADNRRAVVVGERTFGKGSVQEVITLDNKGTLKMTVAYWYLPSGRLVHRRKNADLWGVEPQIRVPMDLEIQKKVIEERAQHERFRSPTTGPASTRPADVSTVDVQLQEAVKIAKVLAVYGNRTMSPTTRPQ